MTKKIIILICIALTSVTLKAQQDGQFTLFPWASLYYNPGAAGEQNNTLCFTGIFANQNIAFKDDMPTDTEIGDVQNADPSVVDMKDFLVNIEFYSRKIRGAIGISLLSDKIGYYNQIGVRLGYTYRMKLGDGSFGAGFQANIFNQTLRKDIVWRPGEEGDPIVEALKQGPSYLNLDFSLGVHYKAETWDVGASVVNILGNEVTVIKSNAINVARHLYVHGGYIWILPWNPSWTIEPKALVKTDFSAFQMDILLLTRYNGVIWGGLSYKIDDAVSVLFGARPFFNSSNNYLKGLDIGVAYGIDTKKIGYKTGGSFGHVEVMIRYCFDIYKTETFFGYGSSRSIYKNQY